MAHPGSPPSCDRSISGQGTAFWMDLFSSRAGLRFKGTKAMTIQSGRTSTCTKAPTTEIRRRKRLWFSMELWTRRYVFCFVYFFNHSNPFITHLMRHTVFRRQCKTRGVSTCGLLYSSSSGQTFPVFVVWRGRVTIHYLARLFWSRMSNLPKCFTLFWRRRAQANNTRTPPGTC